MVGISCYALALLTSYGFCSGTFSFSLTERIIEKWAGQKCETPLDGDKYVRKITEGV
jgi:hypothetical protein